MRALDLGVAALDNVSPRCRFFFRLADGSGTTPGDISGNAVVGTVGAGASSQWGNVADATFGGCLTTTTATNLTSGFTVPADALPFDTEGHRVLLLALEFYDTAAQGVTGNRRIMGWGESSGAGRVLLLGAGTTDATAESVDDGDVGLFLTDGTTTLSPTDAGNGYDDDMGSAGGAQRYVLMIDRVNNVATVTQNGVAHAVMENFDISAVTGSLTPTATIGFGNGGSGDSYSRTDAARYRNVQAYTMPAPPANLAALMSHLATYPHIPIPPEMLP